MKKSFLVLSALFISLIGLGIVVPQKSEACWLGCSASYNYYGSGFSNDYRYSNYGNYPTMNRYYGNNNSYNFSNSYRSNRR